MRQVTIVRMTKPTATVRSYKVDLDTTVRPQDDFFAYVNNKWLAANPIPPTESRWGTFNILREDSWKAMHALYLELTKKAELPEGSVEQQARDFFYTGMHKDTFTPAHLDFIGKQLKLIDGISSTPELAQNVGRLQAMGVNGPWRVFVDADEKDSTAHIFRIHQGGQTLPDRDYYLEASDKMKRIRTAYKKHLAAVHTHFPALGATGAAFSKEILQFETDLAKISRTQADLRDVERNFNKTSFAELGKTYPAIDWLAYAKALGWKTSDQISVDQPEYLAYVNEQFAARSLTLP